MVVKVLRKMMIQLAEIRHIQKDGLREKLELTASKKYSLTAKGYFPQCLLQDVSIQNIQLLF